MALEDLVQQIIDKEINFQTARSGGAGGQNVNKVETKVLLIFDLENSKFLDEVQKNKLKIGFKSYLIGENIIQLQHQTARSQLKNKELVLKKFKKHFLTSFVEKKKRIPTAIPPAVVSKRITTKKINSELKQLRGKIIID